MTLARSLVLPPVMVDFGATVAGSQRTLDRLIDPCGALLGESALVERGREVS